ncbi:MAG: hypothetical protein DRJ15_13160 [Bacteroidetes bacterium]|nr:MAG: hypothetical protein DRJ15_13160 [Bacteroidota bacterium]
MKIALTTSVSQAIIEIDNETIEPIVEPGDGFIYVLNTSNKELGNIIYTVFDAATRFPDKSYQVRFGNQHIVAQVLWDPMPRSTLEKIVDLEIPGMPPGEIDNTGLPRILPGWAPTYATEINIDNS